MHPTRQSLLNAAAELLENLHPEMVTGKMVLQASGVSHGSLYHHFEDASDVVETVMLNRFFNRVTADVDNLREIVLNAKDKHSYVEAVLAVTVEVQSLENRPKRMERVSLIAHAASRPRLLSKLAEKQSALSATFADIIVIAQQRGWINRNIDPLSLAVFFQAFTLGRVLDDVSSQHTMPDDWNQIVMMFVVKMLAD